ncbi:MAG: 3-phosphoshikimate 1-carboxyvinyltransferase [Mucilaginibacter polytrichastri]|nr:3-phosphoshikimate 1-carboxyvinyltransferase [Mucilaginibacter polytrichastri]
MQAVFLKKSKKKIQGKISLTGSKSECNRALMIRALSGGNVEIQNLSFADDSVIMERELSALNAEVNIGPAGTAMRFLTAFFGVKTAQEIVITGSERMKQRPIGILVDALRKIGSEIGYAEKEGFPPLTIQPGFTQKSAEISIPGNISSQFISALLMIAPVLPQGLTLVIENELTSRPYVQMTLAMLADCGIRHTWKNERIQIANQPFLPAVLTIEPDWSAASYWYSLAALSDEADIFLPNLKRESLQGDSAIVDIMSGFGVQTLFANGGIWLKKTSLFHPEKVFDLKECPDLAQTVITASAALGYNARFTGLHTLRIKETDRILALQNELGKLGVKLHEEGEFYQLDCSGLHFPESVSFKTYEDHRMAMALAPLALHIPEVRFDDRDVVGKSYPAFWSDLESVGFAVQS